MRYTTLPQIKGRKTDILTLLFRFRFLTRPHIQTLFNHNDHKKINTWLKELKENHFIEEWKDLQKAPNQLNNIAPIYHLGINGLRFLRKQKYEEVYLNRLKQEKRKQRSFIDKCFYITGSYLNLLEEAKNHAYTLKFYTPTDYPINGEIQELQPSFAYVKESKDNIDHYVCEIIDDYLPKKAIRARLEKYINYFTGEESPTHITFICSNEKIQKKIERISKNMFEDQDNLNVIFSIKIKSD